MQDYELGTYNSAAICDRASVAGRSNGASLSVTCDILQVWHGQCYTEESECYNSELHLDS